MAGPRSLVDEAAAPPSRRGQQSRCPDLDLCCFSLSACVIGGMATAAANASLRCSAAVAGRWCVGRQPRGVAARPPAVCLTFGGAAAMSCRRAYSGASADEVELPESIFTVEHRELRKSLAKIIKNDINPHVEEWEKARLFPAHKVFKQLGSAGFLGVTKPTEYGGLGLDFTYSIAVAEELGTINCGAIPMAIGVQSDMATPALARFGSDKLKKEFLAPTIAGDYVVCLGVSEPCAGSDVANIQTKAVRKGDDLIINGSKTWITNGAQADWMCLLANTGAGPSHKNKSLIVLPMKSPGVHVSKKIDKIGMWSSDTAEIFFEDVRVPASHIIGQEGMGFMYQMMQFQEERLWGAAAAIMPLEKVIRDTAEYARQRKAFGKSVLSNQVVHFRLAELQTELEALRSLLYRTVDLYCKGHDVATLASMSKLKAGRLCRETTDACLQYWGGMGFTTDVLVSRFFRDMRLLSIGGGTDEMMLSIICKRMKIGG